MFWCHTQPIYVHILFSGETILSQHYFPISPLTLFSYSLNKYKMMRNVLITCDIQFNRNEQNRINGIPRILSLVLVEWKRNERSKVLSTLHIDRIVISVLKLFHMKTPLWPVFPATAKSKAINTNFHFRLRKIPLQWIKQRLWVGLYQIRYRWGAEWLIPLILSTPHKLENSWT